MLQLDKNTVINLKSTNEKKDVIQQHAVKLLYSFRRILLSWATGCGKTLGSLKMINLLLKHRPQSKGYIICKETNHLNNWEEDMKRHMMSNVLESSTMFLYASLNKYSKHGFVDYVILDEVHAITEKRAEHLSKIIGPDTVVIMLSATVDYEKALLLRKICGSYHEFNITISEAIEMGILPCPKLIIHEYELTTSERIEYDSIEQDIKSARTQHMSLGEDWTRVKWVGLGSKRKRLMASFKTERARKLIASETVGKRYLCFTGSKEQAESLDFKNYIHSGRDSKVNLKLKNAFNDKIINNLTVVNMFRESMNLVDIEKGFIVQLDNVKLSFIQMLGRVFRSDLPEMHILILKDTRDESYLKKVLEGFNSEYINIIKH